MRRGTTLILATALAGPAPIGCGGALPTPAAPPADAGAPSTGAGGWTSLHDAAVGLPRAYDGGQGMYPCRDRSATPVEGMTCQFTIPDAAVCTGIGIRVHVLIDGAEVPRLTPPSDDGWTFTDPTDTAVELHGAACTRANQSPTGVTIQFTTYLP